MSELKANQKKVVDMYSLYEDMVKEGYIGGKSQIEEFSNKCLEQSKKTSEFATPYYILHTIFKKISHDRDERMVTVEENKELYGILHSNIQGLFKNMKTGEPYLEILDQLIKDFEEYF